MSGKRAKQLRKELLIQVKSAETMPNKMFRRLYRDTKQMYSRHIIDSDLNARRPNG